MSKNSTQTNDATLDSVDKSLKQWRINRDKGGARTIPDKLWQKIFQLEKHHDANRLRTIFGLNSAQYKRKHAQLLKQSNVTEKSTHKSTNQVELPPSFAQVCVENEQAPAVSDEGKATQQTLQTIKCTKASYENFLDNKTMVVECIHQNGHRLKIHTTSERFDELFDAFFKRSQVNS